MTLSAPIDLHLVRRLFARPDRIDASDFLRREIAGRMRDKLDFVKINPSRVLDAGCGDGRDLAKLQKCFPDSHVIGVDASHALLRSAFQKQRNANSSVGRFLDKWLPASLRTEINSALSCADFANLPITTNNIDVVWSNLALHWHPQPDVVFVEWRRVLRNEGLLMFSCFGPDTMLELRQAFAEIDQSPHTLPFVDMHDYGDMLVNSGLSTPVMDMEKLTLTYDSVEKLFADARSLGGNPLLTRSKGLLGKSAYRRVCEALESMRNRDGRIPMTFEVIFGHAFKPIPKKLRSGESVIRLDFPKKQL